MENITIHWETEETLKIKMIKNLVVVFEDRENDAMLPYIRIGK